MNSPYEFSYMIEKLLTYAERLRMIRDIKSKNAFPIVDTIGHSDDNYKHTSWDFAMHNYFLSQIRDSLATHEIISDNMIPIFSGIRTILKDLYPTKIKSGQMFIDFATDFASALTNIEDGIKMLEQIDDTISKNQSDHAHEVVSMEELEKLRNRITILGYQYAASNFKTIPSDYTNNNAQLTNKTYIKNIEKAVATSLSVFSKPKNLFNINNNVGW
jgi:hypothetical protein